MSDLIRSQKVLVFIMLAMPFLCAAGLILIGGK